MFTQKSNHHSHAAIKKLNLLGSVSCLKYFVLQAAMLILSVKCLSDILLRPRLPTDKTDSARS